MGKEEMLFVIRHDIKKAADDAFDPETAEDSDGYDQSKREGLLQALDIVENVFSRMR